MTDEKKVEVKKDVKLPLGRSLLSNVLLLELDVVDFKEINSKGRGEAVTVDGNRVLIEIVQFKSQVKTKKKEVVKSEVV